MQLFQKQDLFIFSNKVIYSVSYSLFYLKRAIHFTFITK